jgi:hypothetical protein
VGLTGSKLPDAQAAMEKSSSLLPGNLAGDTIFGRPGIAGPFLSDVHTRLHYRQETRLNHLADRKTWETFQRRRPGYSPTRGQRGGQAVEPAAGAADADGASKRDCRATSRGLEGIERSIAPALSARRPRSALFLDWRHGPCVAVTRLGTKVQARPEPNRKWVSEWSAPSVH